jgi:hypothetical protein
MNANSNPKDYKYALQWRFDGSGRELTWWDAQDNSHTSPPSWVTDSMMEAITAFDPQHKKIKLGAQAKAFLDNPNIRDYKKFQDIITPEQKTMVINKIIEGGDLTSNTFASLAKDLTDNQIISFITNYVKGKVNVSDYKNMKEHLNTEHYLKLLILNRLTIQTVKFYIENGLCHLKKELNMDKLLSMSFYLVQKVLLID